MSRRAQVGFEGGSPAQFDSYSGVTVSAAQARTGTYSARFDAYTEYGLLGLGIVGKSEVNLRIGLYPTAYRSGTEDGYFVQLFDSGGISHLSFYLKATDDVIQVKRGRSDGTWLAGGGVVPFNVWSCIEIRALIADAPNGRVVVKLDGGTVIDFTGDTRLAGTAEVYVARYGYNSYYAGVSGSSLFCYMDDLAINDTDGAVNNSWCGRAGLRPVIPTGVGNASGWTPLVGPANWQDVDEQPPDDVTTYVHSDVLNTVDTYVASDIVPDGTVNAVCAWIRGQLDAVGTGNVAPMWRIAAANYAGSDLPLDASWKYVHQIYETSPATGVAFTKAEINAAEIGIKVR